MFSFTCSLAHRSWACLLIVLALAAPAVRAAETIKLCYEDADVRPWRTRDGRGLNFVLLDRAANTAGVSLVYESMTWPRCLALLKSGEIDGAFAASFKADRLAIGAYPGGETPDANKRLHIDRYVLLRRRGAAVDWDGHHFSGLDGHIGTQLGYSINDILQKKGVLTDNGAQSANALLMKLSSGRVVAAAMLEGEVHAALAANARIAAALEILPVPLEEKPYYLIFSHALVTHKPKLARALWEAIEVVRNSREYRKEERDALSEASR